MQENEFEKRVEKIMEDFIIKPSEPVWEKVKRRIEERKVKRLFIVLLLFGLLSTGYLMFNTLSSSSTNKEISKQNILKQQSNDDINKNNSFKKNTEPVIVRKKQSKQKFIAKESNSIREKRSSKIDFTIKDSINKRNDINDKELGHDTILNNTSSSNSALINQPKVVFTKEKNVTHISDSNTTINHDSSTAKANEENNQKSLSINATDSNKINDVVKSVQSNKKNKTKLSYGFMLYAGRSNVVKNLYNSNLNKSSSASYVADSLGRKNKPFYGSYNFNAAAFLQKNLSKKLYLDIGLSYNYFSSKLKASVSYATIPAALDLTDSSYYSPSLETRLNKYQLFGVDIGLSENISSQKFPIYLSEGIDVLQLISTNALLYDDLNNIYYYDKNQFKKTQAFLNFGISTKLMLSTHNYIFIGPQLKYGFTDLLKNKNYMPEHFISYGLQAKYFFK